MWCITCTHALFFVLAAYIGNEEIWSGVGQKLDGHPLRSGRHFPLCVTPNIKVKGRCSQIRQRFIIKRSSRFLFVVQKSFSTTTKIQISNSNVQFCNNSGLTKVQRIFFSPQKNGGWSVLFYFFFLVFGFPESEYMASMLKGRTMRKIETAIDPRRNTASGYLAIWPPSVAKGLPS